jgi:hypothetical protein
MKEDKQKQVTEGGHATFSVKVTQDIYDLVNILCEGLEHGTNGNDLFRMFIQTFIESAKHDGPISPDMQHFLNLLKIEPGWHKAFNFADVTAQTEVAQVILILQQKGKHGFGLTMIDKPFMGETVETRCVDDILERIIKVSMPGLYKKLDKVGKRLYCDTMRETLTLLSEYMNDSIDREEEQQEMPCYGENHDYGKAIEYGHKFKRKPHRTPDSVANQQQTIQWTDDDREVADYEAKDWEGEHRQHGDDLPEGMVRPFDQEW